MIALYVIAHVYAVAVFCAALACAHRLARTLATTPRSQPPPQGKTQPESQHTASRAIANTPTPMLEWPRDN